LEEAFANVALAMYNYMTPISGVKVDDSTTRTFTAQGHDMESLLYNFLDELLFCFHTELFVACELKVCTSTSPAPGVPSSVQNP